MSVAPWQIYDTNSERFFYSYEKLSFAKIHRVFLRFLPPKGANCLDVGAGSGRDAIAMAKRGYNVTAVEPSHALRHLAETDHPHPRVRWVDDYLPLLKRVKGLRKKYQFILLSAVWIHIHPDDRNHAFSSLTSLLADDGYIALSIRLGPASPDRVMYSTNIEELLAQAANYGLAPIYISRSTRDSLSRPDIRWKKIVLAKNKPNKA